jgi:hypothetical protein
MFISAEKPIGYASFEGEPCRLSYTEAWVFWPMPGQPAKWMAWDHMEIMMGARVMSERAYLKKFPKLPPLPEQAFR